MTKKLSFLLLLLLGSLVYAQDLSIELVNVSPAGNNNIACQNYYDDPFYLPDGNGETYTDSILIEGMPEGSVVLDTLDIGSFVMNMEHSYPGDLNIELICPNGQSVLILPYPNGMGSSFLGEPIDIDDNIESGIGYNYIFSPHYSEFGLFSEESQFGTSLPEGSYLIEGVWSDLVGCPMNGVWKLEVTDNLPADDGFIFHWGMYFNENFIPDGYNEGAAEIEVTGGIPPYEFQWSNGSQEQNLTHAAPGIYWLTVTDSGRSTDTIVMEVEIPVVVHDNEWTTDQKVSIYPNPAKDFINVELPNAENYNITLVNALGGIILTRSFSGDAYKLNLTELTSGVYYLKVENDSFREIRKIRVE